MSDNNAHGSAAIELRGASKDYRIGKYQPIPAADDVSQLG